MKDIKEGRYESKLMDVLARFQYADAGDRRDIIYGLLGLVSERHPIKVNYAKTVPELFTEVTKFFIDSNANLDIICQNPWDVRERKTEQEAAALPSWVVDFANKRRFGLFEGGLESLLFAQRGIFSAGSPSCTVPCDVSRDGLLRARGVILDKVGIVLNGNLQGDFDVRQHPRKWMQLYFREPLLDDDAAVYQPTSEPLFRAFWRTPTMDCKSYPVQRLSQDEVEADEKIFKMLVKKDHLDEPDILYELVCWDMLFRTLRNWIFTRSKTGLLLMASKEPREDYVLAMLDGGKVPCLLSPFYDNNELRYRVIHSVYVHGYMDGRVASDVEHGRLQKQDILRA
ncbi:hypothetical protein GGR55DRAFT_635050 [Xylaria sp. FL0064]|nr:hypothetical protein GGR55DRAFT_635050 [Xylaria sp. FL0064]